MKLSVVGQHIYIVYLTIERKFLFQSHVWPYCRIRIERKIGIIWWYLYSRITAYFIVGEKRCSTWNCVTFRFPVGFEDRPNRHCRLAMILLQEFKGLILKPDRGVEGLGPTLNDIWTGGKRLIICYGDKHTVNGKFTINLRPMKLPRSICRFIQI